MRKKIIVNEWIDSNSVLWRVRTGFLFFPKKINNEIRWLENVKWSERFFYAGYEYSNWSGMLWLTDDEYDYYLKISEDYQKNKKNYPES
jgi:hypothetical protein